MGMLEIREASSKDTALVLSFVRELAEYEREPQAVVATEEDLKRDGFSADPKFHVAVAQWNNEPAGMAFYFYHYSTWQGRRGVYLEDIFVKPAFRGKGVGKGLMAFLARIAIAQDCYGIRWEVLDWNLPAIEFYRGLGAKFREQWRSMQLQGDELRRLANPRPDSDR